MTNGQGPDTNAVANDRRNLEIQGSDGALCPTQTRRGPPSRAVCASSCLAADCGFRDRCHAQAYSARVLAASRRRAARDGRPAWPATGSRPLRRTLTRVPQKVRLCAAGAACASQLMARGSRSDVHSTPTLDWHPRRGCEGTPCVLTPMQLRAVSEAVHKALLHRIHSRSFILSCYLLSKTNEL